MNDTYRAMEEAAISLLAAGSGEGLFNHLVAMARVAGEMGRPDLVLLNLRAAAGVAREAGVVDGEALRRLETPAVEALSVPFASVREEVDFLKDHVRRMLRLAAHRRVLEGRLHPDLRFEYEVTGHEFDRFVRPAAGEPDVELFSLERDVLAGRLAMEARAQATDGGTATISSVARNAGLSPVERDLVVAALMPALDDGFLRAFMRVWGDYVKREPDVAFIAGLVALNPEEERLARIALEDDSRLAILRLVTTHDPEGGRGGLRRAVRVAPWLVRLALGHDRPARHTVEVGEIPKRIATLAARMHPAAERLAAFLGGHGRANLMVLWGDDREDLLAVVLAASGGKQLLGADLCTPSDAMPFEVAREAAGEAIGLGGVIVLDATSRAEGHEATLSRAAQAMMEAGCRAVLLLTEDPEGLPVLDGPVEVARLDTPLARDQVAAWDAMLGAGDGGRRSQVLTEVAARYPLGLAAIARAAGVATRGGTDASMEGLLDAARSQMAVRSIRLSHRVPLVFTWQDLVLPDEVLVALNEVVTYYRYREQVFDKWGFRRKLPYGRALSALFYGTSGTGKTMAATVLASEFRVPLFQVNLASLVSKYVGETEKNLSMVFDDAARSRAMLLFDEADSLFARRTSGGSALDRYSNLEVNFLLQRMEEFDGLVVLTTNQESAIDDAFKRRIRFKVRFPAPDAALREQLWRSMLKGVGDVSRDVNYAALAARFDIAGGIIKNAVIRAAFQAAEEGGPITMRHLMRAAVRECKEAGQLVRERDADQ